MQHRQAGRRQLSRSNRSPTYEPRKGVDRQAGAHDDRQQLGRPSLTNSCRRAPMSPAKGLTTRLVPITTSRSASLKSSGTRSQKRSGRLSPKNTMSGLTRPPQDCGDDEARAGEARRLIRERRRRWRA